MANFLDENGLLYFWQKIKTVFATQADLTTTNTNLASLQDEVDGIVAEGGEPNVIDTVKVNGSALTPDANKAVNITVAQGSSKGTIAVNGSNVFVKGLGSAAYTNSSAYDSAGAANTAASSVLGSATDSASANTVYGAKAAAKAAQDDVDALEILVGASSVADQISSAIGGLDSSIAAETNKAIASVTITDGKITGSTKVTVPTNNNQLTNGAGYQTASDVSSAISGKANLDSPTFTGTPKAPTAAAGTSSKQIATTEFVGTAITNAISGITGISFEIVQTLPTTGAAGTIYLLSHGGAGTNIYDEYIYVNNAWEKIGTTDVDLSGYWNNTNLTAITNAQIDTIIAA